MSLQDLIELTRRYGGDGNYVLAGGGNTSLKEEGVMYVKASGSAMAEAEACSFVRMSREGLAKIWEADYPEDSDEREEKALADLMDSRIRGETGRPSVETLLHSFIPYTYVVHTHPALVNAMSCSLDGKAWAGDALGDLVLWIPVINPGYILARYVKDRVDEHLASGKPFPEYIVLQNHGVFTGGDSVDEVDSRYRRLMGRLEEAIKTSPDMEEHVLSGSDAEALHEAVCRVYGEDGGFEFVRIRQCESWLTSREAAAPVFSALTPDHIVYMGHEPLWIPEGDPREQADALIRGVSLYESVHGKKPKTLLVQNRGIISCGASGREAMLAGLLFRDAVRVAVLAENFGGVSFMPEDKIAFINTWEVEKYRAEQSG